LTDHAAEHERNGPAYRKPLRNCLSRSSLSRLEIATLFAAFAATRYDGTYLPIVPLDGACRVL
jgi:hypothetical protein